MHSSTSADASTPVLKVQHLTVRNGSALLKEDVCFQLKLGQIVRIAGPNAAGKTTLIRMLLGALPGGASRVQYSIPMELGRTIGYLPQNGGETLLPWLSPEENVLVGLVKAERRKLAEDFISLTRSFIKCHASGCEVLSCLAEYKRDVEITKLSGGERQKLAILRAVISNPALLFLDEPFPELDKDAVYSMTAFLRSFRQRAATILVTHQEIDLNFAETVCL